MEDEHRGVRYSVVRGKGGVWEWHVAMGDPEVLRTGEATTAYHADLKVRQVAPMRVFAIVTGAPY